MSNDKNLAPILIAISIVGYILNIFFNRYLTHNIDAATYGELCIGLNVLEIAATVILLGTEISVVRFVPLLEKTDRIEAFVNWNFRFIGKSLIYFLLSASIIVIFYFTFNDFFGDELHISVYMLFAAPFSAIYALLISYFNSKDDVVFAAVVDGVARYAFMWTVFVVTLSIIPLRLDSLSISALFIFLFFVLILFMWEAYNKRHAPILRCILTKKIQATHDEAKTWANTSFSYVFASIIFLVFLYMDKIIVELVHSSEDVVGHYSLLVVLVGLFTLVSKSSAALLSPHVSKLLSSPDTIPKLQQLIDKTNMSSLFFFAMLFLIYLFFGKEILEHFGKNGEYRNVYWALIWLSVSQIFLEIGKSALRILLYGGFGVYINKVFALCLVLLALLGSYMTYLFGLEGIIAAHIITSFLYMVAFIFKLKKEFAEIKIVSFY